MRQLTIEEKIKAYEYALDVIKSVKSEFICIALDEYIIDYDWVMYLEYNMYADTEVQFPELIKYRPKKLAYSGGYWSDDEKGKEKRIKVLKEIIKELKEALK